ncbi:hypothetical protein [Streptomyces roseoverticillatus]|uniref:hypothetical protein n=1 Tax=Streptomyces roseoverticillatus TaxID=66429 RepID=UPI0004BE6FF0|nr:hypothetical protein [Streptomyces roseoverticillatus]
MAHPVLLGRGLLDHPVGPFRGPASTAGLECFRTGPARRSRSPVRVATYEITDELLGRARRSLW